MRRIIFRQSAALAACLCGGLSVGQTLIPRPPATNPSESLTQPAEITAAAKAAGLVMVPMRVAVGGPAKGGLGAGGGIRQGGGGGAVRDKARVVAFCQI